VPNLPPIDAGYRHPGRLHHALWQWLRLLANDHGAHATQEDVRRGRHGRFPHPGPLPGGEGEKERAGRDFYGNQVRPCRKDTSSPRYPPWRHRRASAALVSRSLLSASGRIERGPIVIRLGAYGRRRGARGPLRGWASGALIAAPRSLLLLGYLPDQRCTSGPRQGGLPIGTGPGGHFQACASPGTRISVGPGPGARPRRVQRRRGRRAALPGCATRGDPGLRSPHNGLLGR
jgi:hypothetical protein